MCGRFYVSEAELDDFAALIEGIEKDLLKPRPNRNGFADIMPGDFAPILIADPESPVKITTTGLLVPHDPTAGMSALHNSTAGMSAPHDPAAGMSALYDSKAGLPVLSIPAVVRVFSWGFPAAQGKGRIFNARAETVAEKPMFRLPFVMHRCLVPARGFYEWSDAPASAGANGSTSTIVPEPDMLQMAMDGFLPQTLTKPGETGLTRLAGSAGIAGMAETDSTHKTHGKSPRIRHRFTRADTRMLAMAGLYWTFRLSAMESLTAFTILTVSANADVAPVHDRMPMILEEADLRTWLSTGISDAVTALLVPSVEGTLRRETLSAG